MNVTKETPLKNVTQFFTMELDYSSLKNYLNNLAGVINTQGNSIDDLR